ncbi:MAG: hypothetical protein ACR2GY_08425 [Phycisphaerales bacterium]
MARKKAVKTSRAGKGAKKKAKRAPAPRPKKARRPARPSLLAAARARMASIDVGNTIQISLWVLGLAGVATSWILLTPQLHAYAQTKLQAQDIHVILPEFPGWLRQEGAEDNAKTAELAQIKSDISIKITDAVALKVSNDVFDRASLQDAMTAVEELGWFSEVRSVVRSDRNTITVDATFAKPFTMIRDAEGSHLVTQAGALLPLHYPNDARLNRQPVIVGAHFSRPWRAGEHWEGGDVQAALALLGLLEGHVWTKQIVEIDISEFMQTESLWLTTDRGARILWGRAPGDERGREVPPARKVKSLQLLYDDFGRIDRNLRELDLALDHVYAR